MGKRAMRWQRALCLQDGGSSAVAAEKEKEEVEVVAAAEKEEVEVVAAAAAADTLAVNDRQTATAQNNNIFFFLYSDNISWPFRVVSKDDSPYRDEVGFGQRLCRHRFLVLLQPLLRSVTAAVAVRPANQGRVLE
eukprot:gene6497-9370_t